MDIKRRKAWICIVFLLVLVLAAFIDVSTWAQQDKTLVQNNGRLNELMEAVKSGKIVCHLTEPNEIKALLGEPQGEDGDNDGAMRRLIVYFPTVEIHFSKFRIYKDDPLTLRSIIVRGTKIDIEGEGPPALRSADDLKEIDDLHDISLKDLDLTKHYDYLENMDFYTSTLWPPSEKLPAGLDPKKLLEDGKNPGLGIRALHEQGINGEGIGIAILDQPLLLGHEEYTSRLVRYDATRATRWLTPQFHGSPVIGIAVGKTCGVAPGAFVFYYGSTTTSDHEGQADCINEITKHNETAGDSKRIRVISISASPENASNNDAFLKARKRALDAGILVVTCAWDYDELTLIEGKDPDKPESYRGGGSDIGIPTRNKTIASHRGINMYKISRGVANSWAPPYIAGLAALAFQVNPELQPQTILEQLVKTATHTKAGPVVNPRGFIESVKRSK